MYAAPEVLMRDPYNAKCDTYSLAIVYLEMACGGSRFLRLQFRKVHALGTVQGWRPVPTEKLKTEMPGLLALIKSMWRMNPKKRPDSKDLCKFFEEGGSERRVSLATVARFENNKEESALFSNPENLNQPELVEIIRAKDAALVSLREHVALLRSKMHKTQKRAGGFQLPRKWSPHQHRTHCPAWLTPLFRRLNRSVAPEPVALDANLPLKKKRRSLGHSIVTSMKVRNSSISSRPGNYMSPTRPRRRSSAEEMGRVLVQQTVAIAELEGLLLANEDAWESMREDINVL